MRFKPKKPSARQTNPYEGRILAALFSAVFVLSLLTGCSQSYRPGRDKQAQGLASGALTGAAAGAVTGLHLSAATGPGAAIGAGLGATVGSIRGLVQDWAEEDLAYLKAKIEVEEEVAYAHDRLTEHYARRIAYHPARDIYPADWFFPADDAQIDYQGKILLREIARFNKKRFPWSRLVVAVYVKSADPESEFARYLALKRSRNLANLLIKYGIEQRRVVTRPIIMDQPVMVIPGEDPGRFSQAVEFIMEDR